MRRFAAGFLAAVAGIGAAGPGGGAPNGVPFDPERDPALANLRTAAAVFLGRIEENITGTPLPDDRDRKTRRHAYRVRVSKSWKGIPAGTSVVTVACENIAEPAGRHPAIAVPGGDVLFFPATAPSPGYYVWPSCNGYSLNAGSPESLPAHIQAALAALEARPAPALDLRIAVELAGAPLADVLARLETEAGLKYLAPADVLKSTRPVTVSGEKTVKETLDDACAQAGVAWELTQDGVVAIQAARGEPHAADGPAPPPPSRERIAEMCREASLIIHGRLLSVEPSLDRTDLVDEGMVPPGFRRPRPQEKKSCRFWIEWAWSGVSLMMETWTTEAEADQAGTFRIGGRYLLFSIRGRHVDLAVPLDDRNALDTDTKRLLAPRRTSYLDDQRASLRNLLGIGARDVQAIFIGRVGKHEVIRDGASQAFYGHVSVVRSWKGPVAGTQVRMGIQPNMPEGGFVLFFTKLLQSGTQFPWRSRQLESPMALDPDFAEMLESVSAASESKEAGADPRREGKPPKPDAGGKAENP